jgi:hypothetical protein
MAESWIRMRGSLPTNPRVIAMARALLADPDFLDWYGHTDVTPESSRAVTLRHVTVVTRVTVGALVPLWAMVNECAAEDGILHKTTLFEVDAMAGVPGFGHAMETVGWLVETEDGVCFPNFHEHNTVKESRSTKAKTQAERAKEYRERLKAESATSSQAPSRDAVTEKRDASRDGVTTDKRREEKSNNPSSLRSEGGVDAPPPPPAPAKRTARELITLATYLANCREQHVKAVPDDHAIRAWAADAGITEEMLQIAWVAFKERYTEDPQYRGKKYKDWAATFANSVKDSWFGLWHVSPENGVQWSSKGLQRKQVLETRQAQRQQQEEASHAPA